MRRIDFDSDALKAAEHWHDGQSSMLYAISSVGYLGCGTARPNHDEEDRPMTDDEWLISLATKLEWEADKAIKDGMAMLKGKRGKERKDLLEDIEGLHSILYTLSNPSEWRNTND